VPAVRHVEDQRYHNDKRNKHQRCGHLFPGRLDETLHPLTDLVAHTAKDSKTKLIVADAGRRRVIKALMNARGIAGEDRAAFFGIIADCDRIIEPLADELAARGIAGTQNHNLLFPGHCSCQHKKSWPVFELTSQLIVASSEETTRSRFRS
ncbi:MAG TPA: hypothetical protein VI260_22570, partial [Blastocatellia bacterium]